MPTNVLGTELKCCCRDPMTGFFRDGFCRTGPEDIGLHTVCVKVTREFLDFSVLERNRAAPVDLEATHASALEFVTLEDLKAHALE